MSPVKSQRDFLVTVFWIILENSHLCEEYFIVYQKLKVYYLTTHSTHLVTMYLKVIYVTCYFTEGGTQVIMALTTGN